MRASCRLDAGDARDVDRDRVGRLVLVFDAALGLTFLALGQRLVDAGHPRHAGDRVLDRILDLVADDLGERLVGEPVRPRLPEGVVEVGPDLALGSRVGEDVARAAMRREQLLALLAVALDVTDERLAVLF